VTVRCVSGETPRCGLPGGIVRLNRFVFGRLGMVAGSDLLHVARGHTAPIWRVSGGLNRNHADENRRQRRKPSTVLLTHVPPSFARQRHQMVSGSADESRGQCSSRPTFVAFVCFCLAELSRLKTARFGANPRPRSPRSEGNPNAEVRNDCCACYPAGLQAKPDPARLQSSGFGFPSVLGFRPSDFRAAAWISATEAGALRETPRPYGRKG
jgi:hypothetical protein